MHVLARTWEGEGNCHLTSRPCDRGAAADIERLAGDEACFIAHEKGGRVGDIVRLAEALDRN